MTHERQGPKEIRTITAAYPHKGCRKRRMAHEFEGGYWAITLVDVANLNDLSLAPEGTGARKAYVTCLSGKHSRWVVGIDALRVLKDRHRSIIGKSKLSAVIDWAVRNGISETLWAEDAPVAEVVVEPVIEAAADGDLPAAMPKWDGKGSPFDAIREFDERGREFWSARRMMAPLGYSRWQEFEAAVDRAIQACRNSGQCESDHLWGATRMAPIGSGATREVRDWRMSRYGAYLVAMNGDPRKPEIAAAQQYFAIRTHQAERAEEKVNSSDFGSILEALRMLTMLGQNHAGAIAGLDSRTAELQKELETTRLRSAKALELAEHVQDRMNGLAGPFTVNEWCQKHGYRLTSREKQLLGTFLSDEAKQRNARKPESCTVTPIYGLANYKINAYPLALLQEFDRYFRDYKRHEHEWIGVARTIDAARRKAAEEKRKAEAERDDNPRQPNLF